DCMVLAPFDLSTELGVPGQLDHPLMTEANARIEAAARQVGMPLGGVAFSEEQAQDLKAKGYRILANFDVLMLKRATAQVAEWAHA
ncbi:MAG: aldolase/citrate lyase family protein, partial [Pseudomonadota bacterium]